MAMLTVALGGCGLTQKVVNESENVASVVFYRQIEIPCLDFFSRNALSTDIEDMSLSTMVHVWQLKTREGFNKTDYDTLLMQEGKTLGKDVLAKHTVRAKPEGTIPLNVPLGKETQSVATIGRFCHPDEKNDSWRLVTKKDKLEVDKPRLTELMRSDLRLLPLKDKQLISTPSLREILTLSFSGELPSEQISERDQLILSAMDNMPRIINCRTSTLVYLPNYDLPGLSLIHQGMVAGIHGLMRQIEETLPRYEPHLSQIQVELFPQPRSGHLNYLAHAQLPGTDWIRLSDAFSPEGQTTLRYLKQQERTY